MLGQHQCWQMGSISAGEGEQAYSEACLPWSRQIFEAVLEKQMGPTRPMTPLTPAQQERVQRLVVQNKVHLHDDDANIAAKIEAKTRDPRVPGFVRTLLWIFTPPGPHDPIAQVRSGYKAACSCCLQCQLHCRHNVTCLPIYLPPFSQKILRRTVNAPARLLFPAAPKLLGAGNARALAVNAIKPYLKKVPAPSCLPAHSSLHVATPECAPHDVL